MDKFLRNCFYLMLLVFTLFIIEIQVKRFLYYSQQGAIVDTIYAKAFDMNDIMNISEIESVRKCEATVIKIRHSQKHMFKKNKQIYTTHHKYMAQGKRVMIEVGGNVGRNAERFQKLYKPRHIILEPDNHYYEILKNRFKTNKRVTVLNVGLAAHNRHNGVRYAGNERDANSIYTTQKGSNNITVIDSTVFFKKLGVGPREVDLLSLDCGGCEYEVMESMFEAKMTNSFKNIQFKWYHKAEDKLDTISRYCRVTTVLSRTHRPTFQFHYVYENWRRKELP